MIDVTLMGCGRWGSRLLRALMAHDRYRVVSVVDPDPAARHRAQSIAPDVGDTLAGDAVFVATPSGMHTQHALLALDAGFDVFVEKPLCMTLEDADALCDRVTETGRIGMVGHVLRFHPLVCDFVDDVRGGSVGRVRKVHARRFTQSGSPDALWTLGPHDLANLRAIDDSDVVSLQKNGHNGCVALTLQLASGLEASIEISTQAEHAERTTVVVGSAGTANLDELRDGQKADALARELEHFANCVQRRLEPRTSFADARWVVATLERADATTLA
jgi:predicted dehydrogenase